MFEDLKTIKLDYLQSMGGNEIVVELLRVYFEQVPEFEEGLQKHLDDKNWIELSRIAHKTKGSISILGMDDLAMDLKKLQLVCEFLERNTLLEKRAKGDLDESSTKLLENLMEKKLDGGLGFSNEELAELEDEIERYDQGQELRLIPEIVHRALNLISQSKNEVEFVLNQLS